MQWAIASSSGLNIDYFTFRQLPHSKVEKMMEICIELQKHKGKQIENILKGFGLI